MVETAAGAETWQQTLVMLAGGAIPFLESYVTSFVGVLVGMPAPLAVSAAVVGNVVCTLVLTFLTGGARSMATRGKEAQPSKRRQRVAKYMDRLGVPGVCLATPLVLPTMFTAPILVGMGAKVQSVILWMTVSIIAWGVLFGFFGDWVSGWFM
ncbi:hypothetical protein [Nesterenkonia xinjiangensis]|uniref:Putative PurR-regulated permease PerM n=1 Tax=Nesterenkonia xinjiangensis TaxID=225327 RepID=A0A7Z0K8F3_9MICC|nr:hypothetical protein [Nesterenkonia xinjiangensis]NYJ77569.1 putative PurR-regulated permease PerM [Nesterenkonia xinjiangensis]